MIAIFLAIFAFAVVCTIFAFISMDADLAENGSTFSKTRPIFLLMIAFVAWFSSVGLLVAPSYTTTYYPTTNVIQTTGNTVIITQYLTYNTTTASDTPIATYAFYEYLAFAGGMDLICVILLIIYMLRYGLTEFKESFDELTTSFFKRGRK